MKEIREMRFGLVLQLQLVGYVGAESCSSANRLVPEYLFTVSGCHRISGTRFCSRDSASISTAVRHRIMVIGGLNSGYYCEMALRISMDGVRECHFLPC